MQILSDKWFVHRGSSQGPQMPGTNEERNNQAAWME